MRARRRALRRQARRGRRRAAGAPRPAPSVHRRPRSAASRAAASRKDHGRLDTIPGFLPQPRRAAAGLRLLRSLRARAGDLQHRGAAALSTSAKDTRAAATSTSRRRACRGSRPPTSRCRRSIARAQPVVRFDDLGKIFHQRGHDVHALDGVSAAIWPGRDARSRRRVGQRQDDARARAPRPRRADDAARSSSTGKRSPRASRAATRDDVRAVQIVFQNPDSALNRRHTVSRILSRSLKKLAGLTRRRGRDAPARADAVGAARRALPRRAARRSSRAGSSSASRSRARSRATRSSSSATSRPRRSTSRCRRRSSTCSSSCRRRARVATSSSRTTSASCATSPTGSPCSTSAA